jgi:hypothetical protein
MLALPAWARLGLAVIMLLILLSALGLLGAGLYQRDKDSIASAVTMLTVGIPVGLVVVALVFGDGGAQKLKALTEQLLREEIPAALLENLSANGMGGRYTKARVTAKIRGCIADFTLHVADSHLSPNVQIERKLDFKLELNVKKVNFVVWLPQTAHQADGFAELIARYKSCFFGAEKEGYFRNSEPLCGEKPGFVGIVFIKALGDDFLLNPAERLYFVQDFAFFIRGLLDAEVADGS